MPNPTLFSTAVDNRSLFSDYYLTERFPQRDDVQALHDEADAAFASIRERYRQHAAYTSDWNEATTEEEFIKPVLDHLGWTYAVQQHVQRQGRAGRPDYALFRSAAHKQAALDVLNQHGSSPKFSGYLAQATKTNSLLDCLHGLSDEDVRVVEGTE